MTGGHGAVSGEALLDTVGVDEVMDVLGWSRYHTLELLRTGELPAVKLGSGTRVRYRVPRVALVQYLEERLTVPARPPAPRPRPAATDPAPGRRRPRRVGGAG